MSKSTAGVASNGLSYFPTISADGNLVAFGSYGTNLVPGGTPEGALHSFLHDRRAGETSVVSMAPSGELANKSIAFPPHLSADGRFVVFSSDADNLVDNDTNSQPNSSPDDDVFVKDRHTGTVLRANIATDGSQANGYGDNASISGNGRYVVFTTRADNLVPDDDALCGRLILWSCNDVFVHDLVERTTELVSRSSGGLPGNEDSTPSLAAYPAISYDGRYVVFTSHATNLDPPWQIGGMFLRDRWNGTTERLDIAFDGGPATIPAWRDVAISQDARIIAFSSYASNLVPGDTNDSLDIFVHDRTCANGIIDAGEHCDDGNASGGDGCTSLCTLPACRGGELLQDTTIRVQRLGRSPSRAGVKIRGRFRLPAVLDPFNPRSRGARIVLEDAGANDRPLLDVALPGAGVRCDPRDGWRTIRGGRTHTYRNHSDQLSGTACAEGSAQGIQRVRFAERPDGMVDFWIRAAASSLEPIVGPLRLAVVAGGVAEGANGVCGGRTFGANDCHFRQGDRAYRCESG